MKEKLTFQKVCADVIEVSEQGYKSGIVFVVALAVVIFMEFFFLALAAFSKFVPLMAVIGVIIALTVLIEALLGYSTVISYLCVNRAKNGQLYVVRDVMYRKETVTKYRRRRRHGGISMQTYKEVYFSAAGKYDSKAIADRIYDETECGETVYLVYTGVFPNKAVYAYSGGKYEPDFEIRL
ncbi:MAG: hypothetical protein IJO81_05580 [Clostridia bacterium]|nr:hypothetical protein [Clostridia bacterium]